MNIGHRRRKGSVLGCMGGWGGRDQCIMSDRGSMEMIVNDTHAYTATRRNMNRGKVFFSSVNK